MKVYTRTGDQGHTRIYADKTLKVTKSADELHCFGTLDELNSQVGLLVTQLSPHDELTLTDLRCIQTNLFQIGFAISATTNLTAEDVKKLENRIDQMSEELPAQTRFILPGGCQVAAHAHVCRTITRRAERWLVAVAGHHPVPTQVSAYVNRLSDYFFVLARWFNHHAGVTDIQID